MCQQDVHYFESDINSRHNIMTTLSMDSPGTLLKVQNGSTLLPEVVQRDSSRAATTEDNQSATTRPRAFNWNREPLSRGIYCAIKPFLSFFGDIISLILQQRFHEVLSIFFVQLYFTSISCRPYLPPSQKNEIPKTVFLGLLSRTR